MQISYWCIAACRHKRQKEEDIAVCECQYDLMDPDSACGERCWNVSTNTECTPGYCRCGVYCKNQVSVCHIVFVGIAVLVLPLCECLVIFSDLCSC